ncbi:hypothetical protein [Streptomyces sp. NPDC003483]
MSSDIFIPGAELDEAQDMLGVVHAFIDIGHHTVDFDAAIAPTRPDLPMTVLRDTAGPSPGRKRRRTVLR